MIENIETNFQTFNFNENCTQILCSKEKVKDKFLLWNSLALPDTVQMDKIISTLKNGIKNADKVVVGIDKVSEAESTDTTKDGIRIPIGIHGANEVQYLTLGAGRKPSCINCRCCRFLVSPVYYIQLFLGH